MKRDGEAQAGQENMKQPRGKICRTSNVSQDDFIIWTAGDLQTGMVRYGVVDLHCAGYLGQRSRPGKY